MPSVLPVTILHIKILIIGAFVAQNIMDTNVLNRMMIVILCAMGVTDQGLIYVFTVHTTHT